MKKAAERAVVAEAKRKETAERRAALDAARAAAREQKQREPRRGEAQAGAGTDVQEPLHRRREVRRGRHRRPPGAPRRARPTGRPAAEGGRGPRPGARPEHRLGRRRGRRARRRHRARARRDAGRAPPLGARGDRRGVREDADPDLRHVRELPQAHRPRPPPRHAPQVAVHRLRQGRARGSTLNVRGTAVALVVAGAVLVADQVTNALVLAHVAPGPHHLLGPLGIDVGRNSGVAFSLFSGHSTLAVVLTLALTVDRRRVRLPGRLGLGRGGLRAAAGRGARQRRRPRRAAQPAASSTSSPCRTGRRSTSPTSRSRFGVVGLVALVVLRRPILLAWHDR